MSLNRSLGWGLVLAIALTVATLIIGFIVGAGFEIPGIVEMESSSSGGGQSTEFFFNPLATLVVALILGLAIWSATRARGSRGE